MTSITTWIAAMMVETVAKVVAVLLTLNGAQCAHALIQMEVGVEQHAHLLQQQLLTQVPSYAPALNCSIQTGKNEYYKYFC